MSDKALTKAVVDILHAIRELESVEGDDDRITLVIFDLKIAYDELLKVEMGMD